MCTPALSYLFVAVNSDLNPLLASFVRFLNKANEAISLVRQSTNKALLLAVRPDRVTNCGDPLLSVISETMRPSQTSAIRLSRLTMRPRLRTR